MGELSVETALPVMVLSDTQLVYLLLVVKWTSAMVECHIFHTVSL